MAGSRFPNYLWRCRDAPERKKGLHERSGQHVCASRRGDLAVDHVDDPATLEFQGGALIRLQTTLDLPMHRAAYERHKALLNRARGGTRGDAMLDRGVRC